jgi:hypothetical protein
VPSPSPGQLNSFITSVAAASDSTAWAVGSTVTTPGFQPPLLMRWDGSTWKTVPIPEPATSDLSGVAATSAGTVWAVGCTTGKAGVDPCINSLMLQWNGTSWTRVQTPARGSFGGIVALSATDVLAVGVSDGKLFILRWNGKTWKVI